MNEPATTVGGGPDLVLLHGWGMNNGVWSSVLPELSARYRVTLIELPGHGGSGYDTGCSTLDDWVRHCLLQAPAAANWIGWSLGGQVALRAALLVPERVRRLVMVCSSPRFMRASDWPHAMLERTLLQFSGALKRDHQQTLARFLALQVQGDEQAREALRLLRQEVKRHPEPHPGALEVGLDLLLRVDLRSQLANLRVPSLWLLGDKDALVPGALLDTLQAWQIPAAQLERIAGCAHAPFLSHKAQSLAAISEFLEAG